MHSPYHSETPSDAQNVPDDNLGTPFNSIGTPKPSSTCGAPVLEDVSSPEASSARAQAPVDQLSSECVSDELCMCTVHKIWKCDYLE